MLDVFKESIGSQYEAAFRTLGACIDQCPAEAWQAPVANRKFCQVVFHTLFFTDYYLGPSADSFRQQPFHRQHAQVFRDYEEFDDRAPVLLYDRAWCQAYLEHCRGKAREVVRSETIESLSAPPGFGRRNRSRAELHVCDIRHLQHHAAQLSLRLRIDFQRDVPWFGSDRSNA